MVYQLRIPKNVRSLGEKVDKKMSMHYGKEETEKTLRWEKNSSSMSDFKSFLHLIKIYNLYGGGSYYVLITLLDKYIKQEQYTSSLNKKETSLTNECPSS